MKINCPRCQEQLEYIDQSFICMNNKCSAYKKVQISNKRTEDQLGLK